MAYSWHLLLAPGWAENSERAPGIQEPPSLSRSAQSKGRVAVAAAPFPNEELKVSRRAALSRDAPR